MTYSNRAEARFLLDSAPGTSLIPFVISHAQVHTVCTYIFSTFCFAGRNPIPQRRTSLQPPLLPPFPPRSKLTGQPPCNPIRRLRSHQTKPPIPIHKNEITLLIPTPNITTPTLRPIPLSSIPSQRVWHKWELPHIAGIAACCPWCTRLGEGSA